MRLKAPPLTHTLIKAEEHDKFHQLCNGLNPQLDWKMASILLTTLLTGVQTVCLKFNLRWAQCCQIWRFSAVWTILRGPVAGKILLWLIIDKLAESIVLGRELGYFGYFP